VPDRSKGIEEEEKRNHGRLLDAIMADRAAVAHYGAKIRANSRV